MYRNLGYITDHSRLYRGLRMATSAPLARPFEAIIFDYDGTAVRDRQEDATGLARVLEPLLAQQVWAIIVTGTNFGNIDRQLCRLVIPSAREHLVVCANRGSEVYGFDVSGNSARRFLRQSTPQEEVALTAIAEQVRDAIRTRTGLDIGIVYDRLNRRKIDLIPLPEWADPPKSRIGELVQAVEGRLRGAGLAGGIAEVIQLTERAASEHGLHARITSDVKHVEVGLTDKGDAMEWVKRELLQPEGIALANVLIAGDEFGPVAGFAGSDDRLRTGVDGAVVVSVGLEPGGAPAGVLHLGGGPPRFRALLVDQVCMRYEAANPAPGGPSAQRSLSAILEPPDDPHWQLAIDGYSPALEHSVEARLAIGNGLLGMRGALAQPTQASHPATFVAGLFVADGSIPDAPGVPALIAVPDGHRFDVWVDGSALDLERGTLLRLRRWLDWRRGMHVTQWWHCDATGWSVRMRVLRFTSLHDRTLAIEMAQIAAAQSVPLQVTVRPELAGRGLILQRATPGLVVWQTAHSAQRVELASRSVIRTDGEELREDAADTEPGQSWTWNADAGQPATLTRIIALARGKAGDTPDGRALVTLERAWSEDSERLVEAHIQAWAERWNQSDVVIEGDAKAQRALRFALYHLISAANPEDEHTSIGARALTGEAYLGHVFWDTEIFMLPFYTFTWPAAARALLMYRYHTLPAARAKAARLGYRGALYAWESADTGEEATPPYVMLLDGQMDYVRSGSDEHHISADVAYAVWQYWRATGDAPFLLSAGAEIVLETARFWASRARLEADGRYHIRHVIGPDEYHVGVDDNAYTNDMAAWNLERGSDVAHLLERRWPQRWSELRSQLAILPDEPAQWLDIAAKMAREQIDASGVIEQFAGFAQLEQVDLRAFGSRAVPLDVLLGKERTQRSQVVKQADVVMALALLWDRYAPHEREASFHYYEPRCGHGSSLSPPVHALVAARLGDMEVAERYIHQTADIDLDDVTGNAALGVHMGALGGLWQAVVFGVAGLSLHHRGLCVEPHLPPSWGTLRFPFHWHGRLIRLVIQQPPLTVMATLEYGRPLTLNVGGMRRRLRAGERWMWRWAEDSRRWQEEGI